jgi:uncharacterized membrane protein YGL010W
MLKPGLEKLFREYADDHRHPTNQLTHKIAIPLIVFHILAMLDWVKLFPVPGTHVPITLAHVAFLLALGWYLTQDVKLGLLMGVAFLPAIPLGWVTPWPAVVAIAAIGWTVQLAGHAVWEKKRPSFFTNLVQALVGPLFFVAVLVGEWPRQAAPAPSSPAA